MGGSHARIADEIPNCLCVTFATLNVVSVAIRIGAADIRMLNADVASVTVMRLLASSGPAGAAAYCRGTDVYKEAGRIAGDLLRLDEER